MTLLSTDELKTLVENSAIPCISLYMPVQKAGPEVRQNPIRFKNLIRTAEERLDEMGIDHQEAMEWLKQAQELDTGEFWENQDQGLAIFISPTVFCYYSFPIEFQELIVVSDYFHLKPLLYLANQNQKFYILTLSQQEVKLFEGTRYSIKEVELELPQGIDEALLYDETAKEGQFRISTSKGGTNNSFQHAGSFHGQGSPDRDEHQKDILQYFHLVDGALHEFLRNKKAPLVLVGVEYLFPLYREANTYQHLVEEGITGSPKTAKPEELHEQALPIVEPLFQKDQAEALERYQELAGAETGKASDDLKEVVSAAYYQRVDSLFVAVDQQLWGRFDPDTMTVDLHPEPEEDDEDLLDFAAIHTLLNGGTIYALESDQIPAEAPTAAIFRF